VVTQYLIKDINLQAHFVEFTKLMSGSGADWTAWLPGTCQVGGLFRQASYRWASMSNEEVVGKTIYPVKGGG